MTVHSEASSHMLALKAFSYYPGEISAQDRELPVKFNENRRRPSLSLVSILLISPNLHVFFIQADFVIYIMYAADLHLWKMLHKFRSLMKFLQWSRDLHLKLPSA